MPMGPSRASRQCLNHNHLMEVISWRNNACRDLCCSRPRVVKGYATKGLTIIISWRSSHGDLLKARLHENRENTFIRGWEGECPKPTCSGLSETNRRCNCRGSSALESCFSVKQASSYRCNLVGLPCFYFLTSE